MAFTVGKETEVWPNDCFCRGVAVSGIDITGSLTVKLIFYSAVVASAARLGFQVVRAHDKNQTILLMTVSILAYVSLNSKFYPFHPC